MAYLLDTNTCIFMTKHIPKVMQKFKEKRSDSTIAISSITLAELEYGVHKSAAYEKNRKTLLAFLALVDILPFGDDAAIRYGVIRADLERKGKVISIMDMLIAAHAKSLGCVAVTNNVREFGRVDGLVVEDWTV